MKVICEKCKKMWVANSATWSGNCKTYGCDGTVHDYFLYSTTILDEDLKQRFTKEAHEKYDEGVQCPKCKKLLTGMHMMSACYEKFIRQEAYNLFKIYIKTLLRKGT